VSEDDPQKTQEWSPPDVEPEDADRAAAHARGEELRAEVREREARQAEDETRKAHEAAEAARQQEEKLSRKERRAKEAAEQAETEAARAREQAERARAQVKPPPPSLSGAHVTSPGVGSGTDPAVAASAAAYRPPATADEPSAEQPGPLERPEVLAGIAFAGAFIAARVLKRIFD
jgi:membrane protein involved in colicin uptake